MNLLVVLYFFVMAMASKRRISENEETAKYARISDDSEGGLGWPVGSGMFFLKPTLVPTKDLAGFEKAIEAGEELNSVIPKKKKPASWRLLSWSLQGLNRIEEVIKSIQAVDPDILVLPDCPASQVEKITLKLPSYMVFKNGSLLVMAKAALEPKNDEFGQSKSGNLPIKVGQVTIVGVQAPMTTEKHLQARVEGDLAFFNCPLAKPKNSKLIFAGDFKADTFSTAQILNLNNLEKDCENVFRRLNYVYPPFCKLGAGCTDHVFSLPGVQMLGAYAYFVKGSEHIPFVVDFKP